MSTGYSIFRCNQISIHENKVSHLIPTLLWTQSQFTRTLCSASLHPFSEPNLTSTRALSSIQPRLRKPDPGNFHPLEPFKIGKTQRCEKGNQTELARLCIPQAYYHHHSARTQDKENTHPRIAQCIISTVSISTDQYSRRPVFLDLEVSSIHGVSDTILKVC